MDLNDLLRRLTGRTRIDSNNPADYQNSVKIEDDKCLMAIAALDAKGKEYKEKATDLKYVETEMTLLSMKLAKELKATYPLIGADADCGFIAKNGEYFFVAIPGDDDK